MPCNRFREVDLAAFVADPAASEWADFRVHQLLCADCAPEVEKVRALVETMRAAGTEGGGHLSERQLLAFVLDAGELSAGERDRVERHLAGCAPCRTQQRVLERFDFAALAVREAAPGRLRDAWRRLGSAFLPTLPRPLLVALLAILVAAPAYLLWRAYLDRESAAPSLAQAKPEPAPAVVEPPVEPEAKAPEVPRPVAQQAAPAPELPKRHAVTPSPSPTPAPAAPQPVGKPAPPEPARPIEIAALLPSEAPRYAPGALDTGSRIGGPARGTASAALAPQVLAPAHVGRTSRESPTLYWLLPEATTLPVEVTVLDPHGVEPLLEATLPGPFAAGIHALRLADHGARLDPNVNYQWFITVVIDPGQRSKDIVSGARVRYEPAAKPPATTPPERLAHAYAEAGLWYDAFDQLSTWLSAEPNSSILHAHRAALLEQVGLHEAARRERGSGGH